MYSSELADTVEPYNRHVFLVYKTYNAWPSRVEDSDVDPLPKLLKSSIKARKAEFPVKTRLTVCGGCNGFESPDGDVLIFPAMVKYRGLKESDVESFVDDVLVNGKPWNSGGPENLTAGAYIFVCSHASRDKRCGVCGPILIEKFKEEIKARQLNEQAFVSACSHVGGHKYAGNVIIFSTNDEGKVVGDWYGYVTPADVPILLDAHIGKNEIVEKLWRGGMGLNIQDTDRAKKTPTTENVLVPEESEVKQQTVETEEKQENKFTCCQGANVVTCCRDSSFEVNDDIEEVKPKQSPEVPCSFEPNGDVGEVKQKQSTAGPCRFEANGDIGEVKPKQSTGVPCSFEVNGDAGEVNPDQSAGGSCKTSVITSPSWIGKRKQSDILMIAGVIGAIATAAVAFFIYRSQKSE